MNDQAKRPNPKCTLEFKQDAAKPVNENGYAHQQAADNLGIPSSAIGRWPRARRQPSTWRAKLNYCGYEKRSDSCAWGAKY